MHKIGRTFTFRYITFNVDNFLTTWQCIINRISMLLTLNTFSYQSVNFYTIEHPDGIAQKLLCLFIYVHIHRQWYCRSRQLHYFTDWFIQWHRSHGLIMYTYGFCSNSINLIPFHPSLRKLNELYPNNNRKLHYTSNQHCFS